MQGPVGIDCPFHIQRMALMIDRTASTRCEIPNFIGRQQRLLASQIDPQHLIVGIQNVVIGGHIPADQSFAQTLDRIDHQSIMPA